MHLRYRFRVYPTRPQRQALARAFGCARVVFNDAVAARRHAHAEGLPYPTTASLSKRLITEAKHAPERAWLSEVSAAALQKALADADRAYDGQTETGIDLGLKSFAVLRGGRVIENPRFFRRLERSLKRAQRTLSP